MLATAQVRLLASAGNISQPIRALTDSGSQLNLITHDCIQRLGFRFTPKTTYITGIGNTNAMRAFGIIDTHLQHRSRSEPLIPLRMLVVAKISARLPIHRAENVFKSEINSSQLADPQYWVPGRIDMLIGAGVWSKIVCGEIIRKLVDSTMYLAQNTCLGWTILASADQESAEPYLTLHVLDADGKAASVMLENLDQLIQRFWEVEAIQPKLTLTRNEQQAEDIFIKTYSRNRSSGRYTVSIPLREDIPALGDSRQAALKRLYSLESRLALKPELAREYQDFFEDYLNTGHMIPAPPCPTDSSKVYYIPYHAICKKKFRIVFDASCVTSTGVSLNDLQLHGPKLQDDLCKILLRFRMHRFAVSADVVKMFRQVQVVERHWNFQRILWRPSVDHPVKEYVITVIVWGMASATFNAVRALRQCATDERLRFPIASRAALEDFYVDDFLSGSDDTDSLLTLYEQMSHMLRSGGFPLSKWCTNNADLAVRLGQRSSPEVQINTDAGVLGMVWSPDNDKLRLKLAPEECSVAKQPTKADIVSSISKLYDPSGIYGPTTVVGKIIMQDFWRIEGLGWKDFAPPELVERWLQFNKDIQLLSNMPVPRWVGYAPSDRSEWHIFTDASEKAYGAVAYLRVIKPNGDIVCNVLTSKSRVAPLKTQSIPRLELFGALLGARLGSFVKSACRLDASATYYWTDSAIVLSWLKKEPAVLSSFIGTRISEIQELTQGQSWHHVRGDCNPADILSRGGTAAQLNESSTWWHGPDWLSSSVDLWPDHTTPRLSSKESELSIKEFKKSHRSSTNSAQGANVLFTSATRTPSGSLPEGNPAYDQLSIRGKEGCFHPLTSRCVTLFGLLRVTALVQRFIANIRRSIEESRSRPTSIPNPLLKVKCVSTQERNDALQTWLRIAQRCSFAKEIAACKQRLPIPSNSKLRTLAPKWNANTGLLVLTGRLDNAAISDDERHPIIVPADHALVTLMIQNAHINKTMHGGPQACIAFLRQRYWILNLRRSVRLFIGHRCTVCIRYRKFTAKQLMGQLPAARVTPAHPFARVGIDFAGPFSLRKSASTAMQLRTAAKPTSTYREPHTTIKGCIVLFVCLVTRAVHLYVIRGLSVDHFLDALVRFISRRGMCTEIWSDNGTTFVGTNNEIQRVLKEWGDRLPIAEMANLGITWKFITPAAPHRGGIWEAGVKTMKHHLYRVMGRRILTADQLYTLVTQIEACMNARPLFRQSDDPSDLNPITPAHLVIGRSTLQLPLIEDVSEMGEDRLTIWGLQQKMLQQFWATWKEDYLTSLQTRNKWFDIEANLSPGDMVVLTRENTPPSAWPLGKVVTTTTGEDGLVREAKIIIPAIRNGQYTTTTLDRPIQKLCVLLKDDQFPRSTHPVDAQLAPEAH